MTVNGPWRICFEFRDGDAHQVEIVGLPQGIDHAPHFTSRPASSARDRGAKPERQRLALDLGVPSGRITDILNARRSITADTALRLGRYFGNGGQFWLDLQSQHDIAIVERERGEEIARRVRPRQGGVISAPSNDSASERLEAGLDLGPAGLKEGWQGEALSKGLERLVSGEAGPVVAISKRMPLGSRK